MNAKALSTLLLPVAVAAIRWQWPSPTTPAPTAVTAEAAAPAAAPEPKEVEAVDLGLALEQKRVELTCQGNGRDRLVLRLVNQAPEALRISVPVGQVFENEGGSAMVALRGGAVTVPAGKRADLRLVSAGLKSANHTEVAAYRFSFVTLPKLEALLLQLHKRVELSAGAVQTAVLALTENLPLSAVAKFPLASSVLPSKFNTDCFRVETVDIIQALTVLREIGSREGRLALTIDPQLKIEAMIDPNARPLAMSYYGIRPDDEWAFWRAELLQGEPSTRHYALYGIARFYPEVALQMLPRWARETRTNPVYRVAAVQALADTQRPEALALLRELRPELGAETELGKAAGAAAEYLDYQLAQLASVQRAVAFRTEAPAQMLADGAKATLGTIVR